MDFDFAKQYKQYTIPQLLEIVQEAAAYQPAAVAAAEEELARRDGAEVQRYSDAWAQPDGTAGSLDAERSIFDEQEILYDPVQLRNLRVLLTLAFLYFAAVPGYTIGRWVVIAIAEGWFRFTLFFWLMVLGMLCYIGAAGLFWMRKTAGWQLGMVLSVRLLAMFVAKLISWGTFDLTLLGWYVWLNPGVAALVIFLLRSPGIRHDAGITKAVLWRSVLIGMVLCGLELSYDYFAFGAFR